MTPDDRGSYLLEPASPDEAATAAALGDAQAAPLGDPPATISVVLGTNLAYEAVSLSTANVVQDIGTMVRQFTAVSTAAIAVATEKLLEATAKKDAEGIKDWMTAVAEVTYNLDAMAKVYGDFGAYAAIVKGYFLPGAAPPPPPAPPTPPTPPTAATLNANRR